MEFKIKNFEASVDDRLYSDTRLDLSSYSTYNYVRPKVILHECFDLFEVFSFYTYTYNNVSNWCQDKLVDDYNPFC